MAWTRKRKGRVEVVWREAGRQRQERVRDPRFVQMVLREKQAIEGESRDAKAPDTADAVVSQFISSRRFKGCVDDTVTFYERNLRPFAKANPDASRWSPAVVRAYLEAHPTWGPACAHHLRKSLATCYRWARKQRIYFPDPVDGLELPPLRTKPRRVLRVEELLRVVRAAKASIYWSAVALAAFAGLSRGDILALTWDEVDLAGGWIDRPGGRKKTGEVLRVPIVPALAAILTATKPLHATGKVCRVSGKPRQASKAIRRIFDDAGVAMPKYEGYHALRRSHGTIHKRIGTPHVDVQALLSHRPGSPETGLYTHTDDADKLAAARAFQASIDAVAL